MSPLFALSLAVMLMSVPTGGTFSNFSLTIPKEFNPFDGDIDTIFGEIDYSKSLKDFKLTDIGDWLISGIYNILEGILSFIADKLHTLNEAWATLWEGLATDGDTLLTAKFLKITTSVAVFVGILMLIRVYVFVLDVVPVI